MAAPSIATFEIRDSEPRPGVHVVVASGEIDLHAAPSLRELLESALERSSREVVLDMSEAKFLDSSAIGVLASHIKAAGKPLTVVCANENVLRVLEISGLARALVIKASLDEEPEQRVPRSLALHVAPKPSELARVRGFADAAALRFGLDPRQRYDFTVAANEAAANAIRHGRPCDDETIHIWVTEDDDTLTLGVRDAGVFEPAPLSEDPLRDNGRGLELMSTLVDGVALSRIDGHTHVELSIERG